MSEFKQTEIPQWVRDYNAAGHNSSAGKAINISLKRVQELESLLSSIREELYDTKKALEEAYLERDELKRQLKDNLPNHCIAGHDEVKFCHIRQGDGWKCIHCAI